MPISGELRITYAVLRRMTLSVTSGRQLCVADPHDVGPWTE